ncbi:MAG: N-6 DNA methylase [Bacilli bacterium]
MADLNGLVKRVRKIMRKDNGVDGDAQRINQLVWMLFLKVYDELKESNEYEIEIDNYKSIIPEEYRWRNWAVEKVDSEGKPTGDTLTGDDLVEFINNKLFPTLRDLPVDETTPKRSAIVKYVFSRLHNYMINGTLIRQVINELNEIDFDKYEDRHVFNDIYESILKELQNAGSSGEFYTPRPVTDFMAEMLDPKPGEKIADFACGTGGFLVSAIQHILKKYNTQEALDSMQDNIIGCECKPLPYLLCVTNMLLNGTDGSNIRYASSLAKNVTEYTESDKVDVVLMNPPFGGEIAPGEDSNFPESYRTSETANLFVCLVLYRLSKNGRVGIILPDGFLFNTDPAYVKIKKKLMSECNLHTIVKLPSGLFYAGITTNILFFDKGEKTDGIWYYQVPLPEGYRSFSKTKPFTAEHLKGVREWWNNRDNGDINAYFVKQDKIEETYNIDFKNPNIKEEKTDYTLHQLIDMIEEKANSISDSVAQLKELIKDIEE